MQGSKGLQVPVVLLSNIPHHILQAEYHLQHHLHLHRPLLMHQLLYHLHLPL